MDARRRDGIGMTSQRTRERLAGRLGDAGIRNVHVLNVIRQVPRHLFVDEALASRAYEDSSLPIGHGQTISQPFVVARMTEILIREGIPERILEIGTGSGYQAAVLAALVGQVHTIERIRALHERSRALFRQLGLSNIRQRLGDGHAGWASAGPFNAIILTAAPTVIPDPLLEQLAEGGELLAPVGDSQAQELRIYRRSGDTVVEEGVEAVSFVPMIAGTE
ncbi:protein-L-isoaspartate(D-aspartate) O-methyltransferase [Spiribacter salinus]|uniref:Protein-L-isoaspartate O-methyltransferase n=1 Tax=Spiribacter salinus TaxID=1335746 RepID=A0A540VUA6_9GAMM|nr:protein-L-isoaspartate(D-aspartate) O-methyltransferase [Spiribacter salinus]MBY5268197.1 protein-L-isoaspartate O-methyltransferase [Spiribacter salinus]MDR9454981.1 protein-L-isoaspartate(D-aspartate) O-methyltransferase [Spiribacter sp.]TQF00348.1 MAG: protein-L-isoaspartate(D-aspartate) O-methyltransferase [Spiribacter salinus]